MKYTRTSKKAVIVQSLCGEKDTLIRRIYENQDGTEFVKVCGCWFELRQYESDARHYEVHRI